MFRYQCLMLMFVGLACGQVSSQDSRLFTGCYEVSSLSWNPLDDKIRLIPKRFELLDNLDIRDSARGPREINFSSWRPRGKSKIVVSWGTGFGGFRGTLKKSSNGDFVGKLRESCDFRCEWKKRTGTIHIHKISCEPG
jgi:hypothetical protein